MGEAAPPTGRGDVHPWVAEGQHRLRFGLAIIGRRGWATYLDWVRRAEALGFDSFWVQDHPGSGFDCWTALAALALRSTTLRLGSLVSCVYYRAPALLARLAADVDGLSQGRLVLGMGIGDAATEFAQLGLPFPPTGARLQALEEAVQIARGCGARSPSRSPGATSGRRGRPSGRRRRPHASRS